MSIEKRLADLEIVLPQPVAPVANYVPFVRTGQLVHISGQISVDAGGGIKGVVGVDLDMLDAVRAARLCGINLIAQMKAAAEGDLERIARVVKLGGFVQAGPDFIDIPQVINGASDLMVRIFGDAGKHARSAVGVYRLPLGFAVEVDALVELKMSVPEGLTGAPIAHRGLWRPGARPENSLAAFEAACAAGYGVELDVQLTADGEAVVFHDLTLDRLTTESGLLEERTVEDLARLTLLGAACQKIPTLAEALAVIAGRGLVLVELKTPAGQEGPLEAKVAQTLKAYDGPAAVLSFNAASLGEFMRRCPATPRGLNAADDKALGQETLKRADFLSIQCDLSNNPQVVSWRADGGLAVAWTVRSAEQKRGLAGRVDNVIFEGFAP